MPRKPKENTPLRPAKKRKPAKRVPATGGPKRRARVMLVEVEDIVRQLLATHCYSPWLNTDAAAKYLGWEPGTLRGWRSRGEGPAYRVVNDKLIRYHVDDLDVFVRNAPGRSRELSS